jgi:hypothetical protein
MVGGGASMTTNTHDDHPAVGVSPSAVGARRVAGSSGSSRAVDVRQE